MLNFWDIVVVAFVGWRVWRGWHRGFVNEIFGLLAIVAGAIGAAWLSQSVQAVLVRFFGVSDAVKLAALAIAFLMVALVVIAAGVGATRVVHALYLGAVNRSFGAAFGVISGLSMALVISFFLMAWDIGALSQQVRGSLSGHVAAGMAGTIRGALPGNLVEQVTGKT